ncbi:DUF1284 domain-containing protein [Alicyclobacillus contaminans]|uniref:DUF1284 domain-containing protein n=1 Tax=Alicyclobacillus contaminans TaxID=392016 RepID=UPI00316AE2E6
MTHVHQTLRSYPDTPLLLVSGPDDLCAKFPPSQPRHCEDDHIFQRDTAVLEQLHLRIGQQIPWRTVEDRIRHHVVPHDIHSLCSTCFWRAYGVCEEGIQDIRTGRGLRHIP